MIKKRVPLTTNRLDAIIEALAMRLAGEMDGETASKRWAYTGAMKWAQDERDQRAAKLLAYPQPTRSK